MPPLGHPVDLLQSLQVQPNPVHPHGEVYPVHGCPTLVQYLPQMLSGHPAEPALQPCVLQDLLPLHGGPAFVQYKAPQPPVASQFLPVQYEVLQFLAPPVKEHGIPLVKQ